jgi:hypothetical protein
MCQSVSDTLDLLRQYNSSNQNHIDTLTDRCIELQRMNNTLMRLTETQTRTIDALRRQLKGE